MKKFIIVLALIINFLFFFNNCQSQWVQTNGPNGGMFYCFITVGTNILAGGHNGVLLSTDNGASWYLANNGLPSPVHTLNLSGTNIFAGTEGNGVYKSTNNGSSWIATNNGLNNKTIKAFAISNNNFYAGCGSTNPLVSKGIYLLHFPHFERQNEKRIFVEKGIQNYGRKANLSNIR